MTNLSSPLKNLRLSWSAVALMLALAAAWQPAIAQTAGAGTADASRWSLGIGAVTLQKAYREMDRESLVLPVISYESKWISATLPTLDVKLFTGESVSLRLRSRLSREGYEAEDSPFLEGMDERKGGLWLGGAIIWKTGLAHLTAEILGDASGYSKGTRAKLQSERRFAFGAFGLTPRLAAEWVDDQYVSYYYGVKASEVRSGRGLYEGKATTNTEAGLRADYTLARRHTVFLDLRAIQSGSTIKESPLVGHTTQTAASLGYIYRF